MDVSGIIDLQRSFFAKGDTKNYRFRIDALQKLYKSIVKHEQEIYDALYGDLKKSKYESYLSEIGVVLSEISYVVKHLKKWMKPQKVSTPLFLLPSRSYTIYEPYGVSLIISPWNYPFQLLISPLIGAIAAGNCAVLKPSALSVRVTDVVRKIISDVFSEEYIFVFDGDNALTEALLEVKFDNIFFTGGVEYGKHVMSAASRFLTPVTLELGGKSPCIVHSDANISIAARRIVWGKLLNCGQTCVAPDYIFVHSDVKDLLIEKIKEEVVHQYGCNIKNNEDYPRIISEARVKHLSALIDGANIVLGGDYDIEAKYMSPTVIDNVNVDSALMQEEIFGPILPILEYTDINDAILYVNSKDKPLALYCFTENNAVLSRIVKETSSGGVCVNDVISHLANNRLPFGGVGSSGMGSYHGRYSFMEFSHKKPVLTSSSKLDVPMKYAPYSGKLKIVKKILK